MNEKQILQDEVSNSQNNKDIKQPELYTDKEAAEYLRISQVTLWRERRAGKISFRRVASKIIYTSEDLKIYLEHNKRAAFERKDF